MLPPKLLPSNLHCPIAVSQFPCFLVAAEYLAAQNPQKNEWLYLSWCRSMHQGAILRRTGGWGQEFSPSVHCLIMGEGLLCVLLLTFDFQSFSLDAGGGTGLLVVCPVC